MIAGSETAYLPFDERRRGRQCSTEGPHHLRVSCQLLDVHIVPLCRRFYLRDKVG
jgi:hypothetical protein